MKSRRKKTALSGARDKKAQDFASAPQAAASRAPLSWQYCGLNQGGGQ